MMEARSNAAAASTPGGEWIAYAGGNFNVDPTRYFKDPACRCNCQPLPKFFPAQASVSNPPPPFLLGALTPRSSIRLVSGSACRWMTPLFICA